MSRVGSAAVLVAGFLSVVSGMGALAAECAAGHSQAPEGVSAAGWQRVMAQVVAERYAARSVAEATSNEILRFVNPAVGLEVTFDARGGMRVRPHGGDNDWSWDLRLSSYGAAGRPEPVVAPELVALGNRVELRRPGLVEWYVNDRRGVEQGFTIEAPPAGDPERIELLIELSAALVPLVNTGGDGLVLRDTAGATVLRYGDLVAFDAAGRDLPARMEIVAGEWPALRIEVDVAGAAYPIVVDPLITTQVAKLTATDAAAGDEFGNSVSISGDTVVVGAHYDDHAGVLSGAAYVFERNAGGPDAWGQVAKLTAADAAQGDWFGRAVSISGDTVVVGAHLDDHVETESGSAYVFERNAGGPDAWGQVAKLTAADAALVDHFGSGVSISGDTVVVGANVGRPTPSAYVFERNAGGADAWGQVAKLNAADGASYFGSSVSISGDTVVVGAWLDNDTGTDSGSAYVFERNAGGADAWGQVAKLTPADAAAGDWFGFSVSISGDAVVVGAHGNDDRGANSGSAYVFERNAGGPDAWDQVAKLTAADAAQGHQFGTSVSIGGDVVVVGAHFDSVWGYHSGSAYVFERNAGGADAWDQVAKLSPADAAEGDYFGRSVSISGDTFIVGASGDDGGSAYTDMGSAYTFTISGCEWNQIAKPVATDAASGDEFGYSVSISGDTLVVGAWLDGNAVGSAYVFERNAGGAEVWGQVAQLTAADAAVSDRFGQSVSISGDTVVVGAHFDDDRGTDSGSAYVFERNVGGADAWGQVAKLTAADARAHAYFGKSVAISGDVVVVGAHSGIAQGFLSGSAYVFERNAGGADAWDQVAKLSAADAAAFDMFGYSASISGDTVVVGAYFDDDGGSYSGSAYVFERNAGGADAWGQVAKLTAADAAASDIFGISVSISGDTVVVGANGDDDGGSSSGSAYVFERNAGGADAWDQVAKLTAADAVAEDMFGNSVSISGDTVVVGAYFDDDGGSNSGSAYVFERNTGGADAWGQVAKLTAADAAAEDMFGNSVSISGYTVVVGATFDDDAGSDSGSAYIFNFNCPLCGDGLHEIPEECDDGAANSDVMPDACRTDCTLPGCGDGVVDTGEECDDGNAIDGDDCDTNCTFTACGNGVVVAPEHCDDGNLVDGDGCDSDCTFTACGNGIVTAPEACDDGNQVDGDGCDSECALPSCSDGLVAADAAEGDAFGHSVSISGVTVVIGALRDDDEFSESGSAYVFEPNAGGADGWGQVAKLTASDAAAGAEFGWSVSISGDTVVLGAVFDDDGGTGSGSAYLFERNAGGADAWGQVAKLVAADAASNDLFGASVSISGNAVVVGAYADDDVGTNSGSAYVFKRDARDASWGQVTKLNAADGAATDYFGYSVSIGGDTVVAGAYGNDDVGADSGSAYVFERHAGGVNAWGQVAKLTATDTAPGDLFGYSVSISGDTVVVGARGDDDRGSQAGSAYVFERNAGGAGNWGQVRKLIAADGAGSDEFGFSVSISESTVLVGARGDNDGGSRSGSAYLFERNAWGAGAWGQVAKLTAAEPLAGDEFGSSVSISGGAVVVGAPLDDDAGSASGSAYVDSPFDCPYCGDGIVNSGEACDDGNEIVNDACGNDCMTNYCGDAEVNNGEACDDGNLDPLDTCANDCSANVCGDGTTNAGELCDYADPTTGVFCDPGCAPSIRLSLRQETDGTLTLEWVSLFHPAGTVWSVLRGSSPTGLTQVAERDAPFHTELPPDAELLFYRVVSRCGDGTVVESEECDDGNQISLDGCRNDCTIESVLPALAD